MASPDNILLHLPDKEEHQIRDLFAQLADRGFPVQNQTPHSTLTFSPEMQEHVTQRAAELLPAVIPAQFRRVGTVVFGTKRKQTAAWRIDTDEELEAVARELSRMNPAGGGERWIPLLTVGLRLPRVIVPDYIRALGARTSPHLRELTGIRAALWKPRIQELTVLAGKSELS